LVVALAGLPGAGKTQLARSLAAQLQWPIVDRDRFPRSQYDEAGKIAVTEAAFAEVAQHLSAGRSCIVDGMTFAAGTQRARLRELARSRGAHAMLLWLDCPLELAIARVAAQQDHPASDRTPALVYEVAERFEDPDGSAVRLDATQSTAELHRQVIARISAGT